MTARAMWKGVIRLGRDVRVPVKVFAAVEDADVHFHLLHASDGVRVEQRTVHPETGETVSLSKVRHAYPLRSGVFVVLTDRELEALKPKSSREIEVAHFLPLDAIAPAWFERPYHLGPDGDTAGYAALAAALQQRKRQGLAQWTMRRRCYHGAVRSDGTHLHLIALRDRDEVLQAPELALGKTPAPSDQELKLAEQLFSALSGKFDPSAFHSDYQRRVHELVEQKARGKTVAVLRPGRHKASVGSLESVLRASVKRARPHEKERKSA